MTTSQAQAHLIQPRRQIHPSLRVVPQYPPHRQRLHLPHQLHPRLHPTTPPHPQLPLIARQGLQQHHLLHRRTVRHQLPLTMTLPLHPPPHHHLTSQPYPNMLCCMTFFVYSITVGWSLQGDKVITMIHVNSRWRRSDHLTFW